MPDGNRLDDLLDPPLWATSRHLLSGDSHREVVRRLEEFSADDAAVDTATPLQRAVMQRDLLGVFHWLVAYPRTEWTPVHRELAAALARAIRKVALTGDEIRNLPSNYAMASSRAEVPIAHDPENPERAFLPDDLLDDDGEWIALGSGYLLPAPTHFRVFGGRSAFAVRMRHPSGRAAGKDYLQTLAGMPAPFLFERPAESDRGDLMPHRDPDRGPWVNPATPQLPVGTAWALVRQAVLADVVGRPVLAPLVESVQIRVYFAMERDALGAQHFFEWEMSRHLLFDGGGFHLTSAPDQRFSHFLTHETDPFEADPAPRITGHKPPTRLNCFTCHGGVGIHSVLSRARLFEPLQARPPEFRSVTAERIAQVTETAATEMTGWELLAWLWPDQPPPTAELPAGND